MPWPRNLLIETSKLSNWRRKIWVTELETSGRYLLNFLELRLKLIGSMKLTEVITIFFKNREFQSTDPLETILEKEEKIELHERLLKLQKEV